MELSYIQNQKITKYAIGGKLSAVTVQDKRIKKKTFMFGWYMPIINRAWVHHIAQLMNKLKPMLHFPIKDARSVG